MGNLNDTIEKVKSAANIVDVVGDYVTLRKAGVNYKGVCPFHDDHSPSMVVSPARQTFKCFVCGEGGDAIAFVQKHEGCTFMEALETLCKKYNIEMPRREMSDEEAEQYKLREARMTSIAAAAKFFREHLPESAAFLAARGFDDLNEKTLAEYSVGYAPAGSVAYSTLTKAGYSAERLRDVGVVALSDRGEPYDVFRDRVMFPFFDLQGRVVGFSGRIVTPRENAGKYVNTGETPLFTKGKHLFGLFQARKAIVKSEFAYLVEGQFDVLTLHRYGVENVIGGSGTAFTDDQVRLIMRFTQRVVMIYDADAAGTAAALKNTELLLKAGCQVKMARLPKGKDPDEFGRENRENTAHLLEDYTETFPRALRKLLIPHGCKDENLVADVRNKILHLVACVKDVGLRLDYMKTVSKDFATKFAAVEQMVREERSALPALPQDGGGMAAGVYGLDVLKEKIADDQPVVLTSRLQDFLDRFDDDPVLLIVGQLGDADVLQLRRTYGYYVTGEEGCAVNGDGSLSDYLLSLELLFRAGVTRIDVSCGDHVESFIDYYITRHGEFLREYTGDKVPLVTRCIALTSCCEENVVTVNRSRYCSQLKLTKGEFDDLRKPFVQQRKSQQKVSAMSDGLDGDSDYFDPYDPPQYVKDNADYAQMWKEYQYYPRLNKKGVPVCYLFRGEKGSGMVQVGDFYMEPLLHIFSDDFEQNKRVLRVNRRKYETPIYLEVVSRDLLKMSTIEQVLINYEGVNFSHGKEDYWRSIREWMSYRYVMCSEIDVYGNQQQDGSSRKPDEQFFAFANGIVHDVGGRMKFEPVDELGVVTHNKRNYYLPAYSTIYLDSRRRQDKYLLVSQFVWREVPKDKQVTFDEWARLMDQVYSMNDNGKWAVLFAVMCAFRSNIHAVDRLFTAPFFVGPMSSGKTQIAVSIRSLFIDPHQSIFNLNTGTDAAMQTYMAAFRDVPIVLDEYNNTSISPVKFQALKSIVYDGEDKLKKKGSNGKDFEADKVFAPVILCGQEMPQRDDNALMSRVIICEVPKPKDRTPEQTRLFERLKDIEDPQKCGLSNVLMQVLSLRPAVMDHFRRLKLEAYNELRGGIVNSGETDRMMKTASLFLGMMKLIEQYSTLHLPFTYDEFFQIVRSKVNWQLSLIRGTDRLATFFTNMNILVDTGLIREGREFRIQQPRRATGNAANGEQQTFTFGTGQDILAMRLQQVFGILKARGYEDSTISTIEQNLRSHPSYLCSVPSWRFEWSDVVEEHDAYLDKVVRKEIPRRTTTSAVLLDYAAFRDAYRIDFRRDADLPDDDDQADDGQPEQEPAPTPQTPQEGNIFVDDGVPF